MPRARQGRRRLRPHRETAFSSYAVPSIAGAIKRHFRDYGWSLHMPRDLQELALRVERISEGLSGPTGAAPTAAEIARHAGVSLEEVLEAREAYHALHAVSLERREGSERDDSEPLLDTLAAADTEIPSAEDRVMLDSLLATLDPRSEQIVRLYYQHDLTQAEIGRQLGYSQMHVSRLLRQAVGQLARAAEPEKREANRHRDWIPVAARTRIAAAAEHPARVGAWGPRSPLGTTWHRARRPARPWTSRTGRERGVLGALVELFAAELGKVVAAGGRSAAGARCRLQTLLERGHQVGRR